MGNVALVVSLLFNTVPVAFLRYCLFFIKDKLRIPKWLVVFICIVSVAAQAIVLVHMNQSAPMTHGQIQMYKLVANIPWMIAAFIIIRENVFKQLFVYALTSTYNLVIIRLTGFIDLTFLGGGVAQADYFTSNIITLCLLALTLPLMMLFLRRTVAPALKSGDNSIWRVFFLVPGMYLLVFFIFISDMVEGSIGSTRSVVMIAAVMLGMLASVYLLLRILRQATQNARLEAVNAIMNRQLDIQRDQYTRLTENAEQVKTMRHDMRHQLGVIRELHIKGDDIGLGRFLDEAAGALPSSIAPVYCKNYVVNAVAEYYMTMAQNEGIVISAQLDVPEDTGQVHGSDLCIIMGNLLENALEACRRVKNGNRFVHARAKVQNGTLSIVVENSYDGNYEQIDGRYLSRKRQGTKNPAQTATGIGLSSVQAVCEKNNGILRIKVTADVWKSAALVDMKGIFSATQRR